MPADYADRPDAMLVVAAILGDVPAFDALALRYRPAVVRTAETIVGGAEAEDVAQDALLLAFKALPGIEDPERFAAWLLAITRHRALRVRERTARRQHVALDELLLDQLHALQTPPAPLPGDTLEHALRRLPPDYALALRLFFLDEMPQQHIAAALDVPLSTVKWRVYRGKHLLRQALDQLNKPIDQLNKSEPSWNASTN